MARLDQTLLQQQHVHDGGLRSDRRAPAEESISRAPSSSFTEKASGETSPTGSPRQSEKAPKPQTTQSPAALGPEATTGEKSRSRNQTDQEGLRNLTQEIIRMADQPEHQSQEGFLHSPLRTCFQSSKGQPGAGKDAAWRRP